MFNKLAAVAIVAATAGQVAARCSPEVIDNWTFEGFTSISCGGTPTGSRPRPPSSASRSSTTQAAPALPARMSFSEATPPPPPTWMSLPAAPFAFAATVKGTIGRCAWEGE
ncbi:hypothetical protein HYDPIDRAFT_109029 [Hydnomerulius pinastri MD-312]|nr:hypothetical protein HYDPIDRAFT_109029 [Hydnomerulius pinastri MD-312]